ncbi:MAG: LysR family transcriptional regulator [Beijerinckiaceae bacterium]
MTVSNKMLDLDAVQAFLLVTDLESFTRAAQALETTQAAVSLRLKRLEERLGRRLLERTPREIRLTTEGAAFLGQARDLIAAHERALAEPSIAMRQLRLGISDHAAGAELPSILSKLHRFDPALVIAVQIGRSRDLLTAYEKAEFDAVLVRREDARRPGENLAAEPLEWFASPEWSYRRGEVLRVASLASPCSVRAVAIEALEKSGLNYVEIFVGGGVLAVGAAISAGLGVAALARRTAPPSAVEVGKKFGLPPLPLSHVVLHTRVAEAYQRRALKIFAAAFRAS